MVPEPRFSSPRERRLWFAVASVVAVAYAVIPFASTLAVHLRNELLTGLVFTLAFLLVLAAILTQGLNVRPRGHELGVGLGIAACYLLVFVRLGTAAERTHLMEYSVVGVLVFEALTERRRHRTVPAPWLLALLLTVGIGALDEGLQWFLPNRVFDPEDLFFNTLAAVMAVVGMVVLRWVRGRWGEGS